MLLVGLLLGFFLGVGAVLVWAASGPPGVQTRAQRQLSAEAEAVLQRLTDAAELVGSLMRDVVHRGQK
jgi:hypothetical protein